MLYSSEISSVAFAIAGVLIGERTNVVARATNMIRRDTVFFIKNN